MRAVITRVASASVASEGKLPGEIGPGFLILLGVGVRDTEDCSRKLADKIAFLRVFEDEQGKMNLSLKDTGGSMLVISQFTLYGSCRRGRRPDFLEAAKPELAVPLYEAFTERCRAHGFRVETGSFGAHMLVTSVNDGPVTFILDTDVL